MPRIMICNEVIPLTGQRLSDKQEVAQTEEESEEHKHPVIDVANAPP